MRDGWAVVRLSEIANRKTLKNLAKIDLVFTVSAQRGLITQEDYFTKRVASSNLTNYYVVQPGDYVFNKSYSVDAPFGVIAKNTGTNPGLVSPLYIVFGAKREIIEQDFLGLALTSAIFWKSLEGSLKEGGRGHGALNLKVGDFFEALLPLPPIPEQKRIVDLISSVDSYIEALQQQLESAKKSRNAVLHELLTTGGDDWLETTLGEISEVIGGGTPSTSVPEYWEGEIVWLTPTEITSQDGEFVSNSNRKISELGLKNSGAQMLPKGSVILTSRASVGFVAISAIELCTNQGFQSLVPNDSVLAEFLMFWIQQNRSEFESRSAGSTFKEISKSNVKSIKLSLPPLSEQRRVVEVISTIDEVKGKTEIAINEAKRLRSGLLSDLLSGEHEIPASYDKVIGAA